jgi:hypothetical protein
LNPIYGSHTSFSEEVLGVTLICKPDKRKTRKGYNGSWEATLLPCRLSLERNLGRPLCRIHLKQPLKPYATLQFYEPMALLGVCGLAYRHENQSYSTRGK